MYLGTPFISNKIYEYIYIYIFIGYGSSLFEFEIQNGDEPNPYTRSLCYLVGKFYLFFSFFLLGSCRVIPKALLLHEVLLYMYIPLFLMLHAFPNFASQKMKLEAIHQKGKKIPCRYPEKLLEN